jgi:hypothetical protein
LAAALVLGATSAPRPAPAQQSPETAVLAVVRQLFDGMRAGDSAMARTAFDAMAELISVSGPDSTGVYRVRVTPVAQFLAAIGRPHTEVWDERIWDTEVRVDGGLASMWTKYAFYRADQFSHCGVDAFQLVLRPDGWKIMHVADTQRTANCWKAP